MQLFKSLTKRTSKKAPVTVVHQTAMVRVVHPETPGLYYRQGSKPGEPEWVARGYTTWTEAEWQKKFAPSATGDRRRWEHYGYVIPLYDEGDRHD